MTARVLVTGAAGFIGSNLVHHLLERCAEALVVSFDALTYAGNLENLADCLDHPRHSFVKGDIRDPEAVASLLASFDISAVLHLAAESHVDRSIVDPLAFVRTNVEGTANLLLQASSFWGERADVRFVHVSTDEVFGTLGPLDPPFSERTPYAPHSPYSASKAASDHLARAWRDTYGLPVIVTNCTNNYGPWQFPEKLIPVVIARAMANEPVPVYGVGANVRDWLHVSDHCRGIVDAWLLGTPGETYCFGGATEVANIELVERLLDAVDRCLGRPVGSSRALVTFVKDRPGHDFRYAMAIDHARQRLGWSPSVGLDEGLDQTVRWYVDHRDWCERARSGACRAFEAQWYAERLASAQGSGPKETTG